MEKIMHYVDKPLDFLCCETDQRIIPVSPDTTNPKQYIFLEKLRKGYPIQITTRKFNIFTHKNTSDTNTCPKLKL